MSILPETIGLQETLQTDGFCVLRRVFSSETCDKIRNQVDRLIHTSTTDAICSKERYLVGARNLQQRWAGWRDITNHPRVHQFLLSVLGPDSGLVRILFFDKPPGKGWSLALHKDRTIAVQQHRVPATPFKKPTTKAGVPHVEATDAILKQMVTLRLHLDPMHGSNGPITVIPSSHEIHEVNAAKQAVDLHCDAGDVLAMRPLLTHGSRHSDKSNLDHRRVLHLEFAADKTLPAGYEWHQFDRLSPRL